jgi:putative Mg2+ transporter-C (MgtC) family protein
VGFIGAGFIIKLNNNIIVGMTDASVIWISAGIGMAIGFEYYILASYTLVPTQII